MSENPDIRGHLRKALEDFIKEHGPVEIPQAVTDWLFQQDKEK